MIMMNISQSLVLFNASDRIFAVSAYCPITNLEHADMAYEWEFHTLTSYEQMDMSKLNAQSYNDRFKPMPMITGTLNTSQIATSKNLQQQFPDYFNSLHLTDNNGKALLLDKHGNGSFKNFMATYLIASANKAITEGQDLSHLNYLTLKNGQVVAIDFEGYVQHKKRMKTPPAFDSLNLSAGENNLFGDSNTDNKHFTSYSFKHSTVQGQLADKNIIRLMNAMNYVNNPHTSKHWRIRAGTDDYDTSHATRTLALNCVTARCAISLRRDGVTTFFQSPREQSQPLDVLRHTSF